MDAHEAELLLHLRQRFNQILRRVVGQPQKISLCAGDQQCIELMARSLDHEERFCGLEQQRNVGRRPIAVKLNMTAEPNSSGNGPAAIHDRQARHINDGATGDNDKFFQQSSWRSSKRSGDLLTSTASSTTTLNSGKQMAGSGRFGSNGATSKLAVGLVRSSHSAQNHQRNDRFARAESRVSTEAARFFIVHASSEMQVQQHFREPTSWCWSQDVLKDLIVTNIVSTWNMLCSNFSSQPIETYEIVFLFRSNVVALSIRRCAAVLLHTIATSFLRCCQVYQHTAIASHRNAVRALGARRTVALHLV